MRVHLVDGTRQGDGPPRTSYHAGTDTRRTPQEQSSAVTAPSDGYLAAIVASFDSGLIRLDLDGLITGWNPGATRLFGYQPGDVAGSPAIRLVPEQEVARLGAIIQQVVSGEIHAGIEVDVRHSTGAVLPAALTLAPIRNVDGDVTAISVIARDLTEQRDALATLAASETRLRESEALAHVGGWVLDVATGSVQWSAELHRIHGLEPTDFDGSLAGHLELVHPADRPALEAAVGAAVNGEGDVDAEYRVVRRDRTQRWLYMRAEPVFGHATMGRARTVIGLRGICQDVTERHDAEQAMRDAYEREREAAEGLRASDRVKDEFLATVSHELRTPLTAIIGFSHLISVSTDQTAIPALVAPIERNAAEMRGMIERLLDFSQLEAGKFVLNLHEVGLDRLVSDTAAAFRTLRGDHDIRLVLGGGGAVVLADLNATAHVIGNLLSNAVKFSPEDKAITVTTTIDSELGVVTVADEGPGIPADLLKAVFERFFQVPDRAPGRRGTGVGLAIVRRYVELQGGTVWCESPPGGGTVVTFTLPLVGMVHQ